MRIVAILLFLCWFHTPAAAESRSERFCTLSSPVTATIKFALENRDDFECSDRGTAQPGPRVWTKFAFDDSGLPAGLLEVQGDNNGLSTMAIFSVLDDGTIYSHHYSAQQVRDFWRPKGLYGLPVPQSDNISVRNRIRTVYLAIDNPSPLSSVSMLKLRSSAEWDELMLPISVIFALLCGMTVMPLFYNLFFYGALRYRFMLWQSVTVIGIVAYTVGSSGLIFVAFPSFTLFGKMMLNYWSLAISVAASGFFLISFLEQGTVSKSVSRLIIAASLLPLAMLAAIISFDLGRNMTGRHFYHAAFLPYALIIIFTMFHAARRGSRAIWFQIAAWAPILILTLDRVARGMDLYVGITALDYGLYFALVIESIILAFGVAQRILHLRLTHETALRKQVELRILAETDGLTMIGNRRAFEAAFAENITNRTADHLAIIDIDYFKRINDEYGHEIGDDVLRTVGQQLRISGHIAARIGGEEFALLIQSGGADISVTDQMIHICERLIKTISIEIPTLRQQVTFSVGMAPIIAGQDLKTVMAIADRRLYFAKNNGRNQVISFDVKIDPPKIGRRQQRG